MSDLLRNSFPTFLPLHRVERECCLLQHSDIIGPSKAIKPKLLVDGLQQFCDHCPRLGLVLVGVVPGLDHFRSHRKIVNFG